MTVTPVPTIVHPGTGPRDPKKRPFPITLYDENGDPIDLTDLGGGAGSVPNPVTWQDLMPYAGPGVRDYAALNPTEGFDHPGYFAFGGEIFLNGVFDTQQMSTGVLFTLPLGLRPRAARGVMTNASTGARILYVFPDGTVKQAGGTSMSNTNYAVLAGSYLL